MGEVGCGVTLGVGQEGGKKGSTTCEQYIRHPRNTSHPTLPFRHSPHD